MTLRRRGASGLKELLRRILDFRKITRGRWYAAILLLPPLLFLGSLASLVVLDMPVPPPLTPLLALPAILLFFFLLATGEEVGWMGFAFQQMQARAGALRAATVLGLIWALWHLPFFVFMMPDPLVLTAQLFTLVGIRILVAWIFNNTGHSVFAAILFHAVDNTALVTFPEINAVVPWGSVILCGFVVIAAIAVTILWGPESLARFRFGTEHRQRE